MMPGARPLEMLAESLAGAFNARMGEVIRDLRENDDAPARSPAPRTRTGPPTR